MNSHATEELDCSVVLDAIGEVFAVDDRLRGSRAMAAWRAHLLSVTHETVSRWLLGDITAAHAANDLRAASRAILSAC
jgi:hypothetical protein